MTPASPDPWRDVTAARLSAVYLSALAPIRHREDVRLLPVGSDVWVRWPVGRSDVVRCLMPVPGIAFFTCRTGVWFRYGCLVPSDDVPSDGDSMPVAAVLVPSRFEPLPPEPPLWTPVVLTVVRGGMPQSAVAIASTIGDVARWANAATTAELAAVRGALSGDRVLLLGGRLPAIPSATRYWGNEVLVPVGFRPDPDLPESALREAVGVVGGELLLLDEIGAEVIPRVAFEPLTRAGVRMGARPT